MEDIDYMTPVNILDIQAIMNALTDGNVGAGIEMLQDILDEHQEVLENESE